MFFKHSSIKHSLPLANVANPEMSCYGQKSTWKHFLSHALTQSWSRAVRKSRKVCSGSCPRSYYNLALTRRPRLKLKAHLNINVSVLCHREDSLGGHQKEVSVVQFHVEGDISVGWVLEATGIPHLGQAAVKLGGKTRQR